MKLSELQDRLSSIPGENSNTRELLRKATFPISDFKKVVPKEVHRLGEVEFNHENFTTNIVDEEVYEKSLKKFIKD